MKSDGGRANIPENEGALNCPICGQSLSVELARGRKSGKPFVMLRCVQDGRHFRAFINHRPYVEEVLSRLESRHNHDPGGHR